MKVEKESLLVVVTTPDEVFKLSSRYGLRDKFFLCAVEDIREKLCSETEGLELLFNMNYSVKDNTLNLLFSDSNEFDLFIACLKAYSLGAGYQFDNDFFDYY